MNFQVANGGVSAINTNLLTGKVSDWFDARGYAALAIHVVGSSGISAGAIILEGTNDKTLSPAGVALPLMELTASATSQLYGAQTIAASTNRFFVAPVLATYIRLRVSTGFTGGTVSAICRLDSDPNTSVAPTQLAVGAAAHSSAASGNPVQVGGVVATNVSTSEVNGDAARLTMTTGGQLLVKVGGLPETDWQFTGVLVNTTPVAAKAAAGASTKNYCTDLSYQNTSATATTILLLDNATVIGQWHAPANMALPAVVKFATPRKGSNNTAMNVNCGTTGANVLINVAGYAAP